MFSLVCLHFTVTADPVNFDIIGKNTRQSSNFNNRFFSSNAVDGCKDPVMGNGCCTHTDPELGPGWWTVDIGKTVIVNSVTVYNRVKLRKYTYNLVLFYIIHTTSIRHGSNVTREHVIQYI